MPRLLSLLPTLLRLGWQRARDGLPERFRLLDPREVAAAIDVDERRPGDERTDVLRGLVADRILVTLDEQHRPLQGLQPLAQVVVRAHLAEEPLVDVRVVL